MNCIRFPGQYYDQETNLHYNYFRYYDSSIGRYIKSDPIGLDGGMNTYGYVGQNPVVSFDPYGLVEWTGSAVQVGGSFFFGGLIARFNLKTKCINGKEGEVTVWAVGPSIGFGGKAGFTASDVTFEDGRPDIVPNVFNGEFAYGQFGGARGPVGGSISGVKLGSARQVGVLSWVVGFDQSATFTYGSSTVTDSTISSCACDN